jgi:diguanylate cyclase (GGDEF)-like protein
VGPCQALDPALRLAHDLPTGAVPTTPRAGLSLPDPPPADPPAAPDALRLWTAFYVAALLCTSTLLGLHFLSHLHATESTRVGLAVALAGSMIVAWLFPMPFAFQTKVYLDTSVIVASMLLFEPGVAIVVVAGGTAVAHALRRRTPAESMFNTAQTALQTAAGGLILGVGHRSAGVFHLTHPVDVAIVLLAAGTIYLVNTTLVAGVIAIQTSADPLRVWRDSTLDTSLAEVLTHLSQVGIGLIAAIAAEVQPWSISLLILPSVTIYTSFSRHLQLRRLDPGQLRGAEANAELAHQEIARHVGSEHLIDLADRRHFLEHLDRIFADRAQETSNIVLMAINVDRVQVVNDGLDHEAGERFLTAVAHRLRSCLPGDGLVARLEGDEFAILLDRPHGPDEPVGTARRLLAAFSDPFAIAGHDISLTVSVGIAKRRPAHVAPLDLMRDADAALFLARQRGKAGYAIFDPAIGDVTPDRLELETDLRHAVERGELSLLFQPIVALRTGRIEGFETLVHWRHPRRGPISPATFVPLVEESGLSLLLGQWVLTTACSLARRWQGKYRRIDTSISVNLSAGQFQQPELVAMVAQALEESGLDPGLLRLEITESVVMADADTSIGALRRLKALGVEIAIDGFGTGYSSLSSLRRFPVDLLKIDRSFVSGLGHNSEDTSITQAVISLGHALSITVAAEGIDSIGQLLQLCSLDCELGQGSHFSEPLPAADAEALLTSETLSLQPVLSLPLHLAPTVA